MNARLIVAALLLAACAADEAEPAAELPTVATTDLHILGTPARWIVGDSTLLCAVLQPPGSNLQWLAEPALIVEVREGLRLVERPAEDALARCAGLLRAAGYQTATLRVRRVTWTLSGGIQWPRA